MGTNQSSISLCIGNNYKRYVFTREKIIKKGLSFRSVEFLRMEEDTLFCLFSLSLFPLVVLLFFVFILHLFTAKSGETRWQGVAFLLEEDNSE